MKSIKNLQTASASVPPLRRSLLAPRLYQTHQMQPYLQLRHTSGAPPPTRFDTIHNTDEFHKLVEDSTHPAIVFCYKRNDPMCEKLIERVEHATDNVGPFKPKLFRLNVEKAPDPLKRRFLAHSVPSLVAFHHGRHFDQLEVEQGKVPSDKEVTAFVQRVGNKRLEELKAAHLI